MDENPFPNEEFVLNDVTLEKERLVMITHISEEVMAEIFAEPAEAAVSRLTSWLHDRLTLRVTQPVWTQSLKEVEITYPKTVWEHLKKQYAPPWVIQRWPVRCDTVTVDVFAAYPELAFPKEAHFVDVRSRGWSPNVRIEKSRRNGREFG